MVTANFAREIRNHQRRMDIKANKVIDPAIISEGVIIFMSYNPSPHQYIAWDSNISCRTQVVGRMWKVLISISSGNIVEGIGHEEILNKVAEIGDEIFQRKNVMEWLF